MRIGIVGSSGGSAFGEMVHILESTMPKQHEYYVITDRACGLEAICINYNYLIKHKRIIGDSNASFSNLAKEWFTELGGVDFILLFFTRLVTADLFRCYPTFNIHPALLPAFKGLHPIRDALRTNVRFFGTTLHMVDSTIDGGPIIAQTCMPIHHVDTEERLGKYAFIHKVYLSLLLVELFQTGDLRIIDGNKDVVIKDIPGSDRCNPCLRNPHLKEAVIALQMREKVEVIR